jgi:hypothetical protein
VGLAACQRFHSKNMLPAQTFGKLKVESQYDPLQVLLATIDLCPLSQPLFVSLALGLSSLRLIMAVPEAARLPGPPVPIA